MDEFGKHRINTKTNIPLSLGVNCSKEAYLNSNWIAAIDSWDFNDAKPLEEMLTNHPIPFELQPILVDIISGKRKQNIKSSVKQKVPAAHRIVVAGIYKSFRQISETVISKQVGFDYHNLADDIGIEPIELLNQYRDCQREYDIQFAKSLGISLVTLRGLVKNLNKKLNNYPKI